MDIHTAIARATRIASSASQAADACTAPTNWPTMASESAQNLHALIWLRDHPGELPPVEYRYAIAESGVCPAETLALIAADDASSQDTLSRVIRADPALRGTVADTLSRRWGYTPAIVAAWRNG